MAESTSIGVHLCAPLDFDLDPVCYNEVDIKSLHQHN